jgi:putative two-component system response regulator
MIEGLHATRRSRVLVADDTESVRSLFERLLSTDGHEVISATDGRTALDVVQRERPDVILLDVEMPGMDGLEVCRRLKADPATRLTPVVMVTGQTDLSDRIRGIEAGADEFLSKPVHPQELRVRVRSLSRVKHLIDALDSAEAAFVTLALTIEARDPSTNGHCERLARHAVRLGRALGLGSEDLDALHRGGYLHDVGKVGVPDAILLKPGPLTSEEFALCSAILKSATRCARLCSRSGEFAQSCCLTTNASMAVAIPRAFAATRFHCSRRSSASPTSSTR